MKTAERSSETLPTPATAMSVFVLLLVLLSLSAVSSHFLTGRTGTTVGLLIAAAKMTLIFTYFMRLRYQSGLVRLFALVGFFWLGLILLLTFADYLTRG
ncbi:MAG TPA: cytochrome C oxidase subunit IV family protein [Lacunisphaera sp.]|jgi:cytochrome c oxidase subunit 4